MSVWVLYIQLFARNWRCGRFAWSFPKGGQKERRCHDSREMLELINSDPAVLDALVTCDESWIYFYDPKTKRQSSPWTHASSPWPKNTGIIYMHWVPTGQTVNKEYYVEVLRELRKRFRRKSPALFKLGQLQFHQGNSPVHNSILITDYLTKMGIKTVPKAPYSPDLAPCDFWLFQSG